MNILFTSVGRRVELIQAFHDIAIKSKIDLIIYGADISETAPALFFCDKQIKICRISDPLWTFPSSITVITSLMKEWEARPIRKKEPKYENDLQIGRSSPAVPQFRSFPDFDVGEYFDCFFRVQFAILQTRKLCSS